MKPEFLEVLKWAICTSVWPANCLIFHLVFFNGTPGSGILTALVLVAEAITDTPLNRSGNLSPYPGREAGIVLILLLVRWKLWNIGYCLS